MELLVDGFRNGAISELGMNVGFPEGERSVAWQREREPILDRKCHTYESGSWENVGYIWELASVTVTWSRRSVW